MRRAWLIGFGILGCSAAPEARPEAPLPAVNIETEQESKPDSLWKRLSQDKLEGLAMVRQGAVLYPTAADARKGASGRPDEGTSTPVAAVHILADEGDVVEVRTWLSPRVRNDVTPLTDYDLNLYVTREQLVPVLREALSKRFDDGSGYALLAGLPLHIEDEIRPQDPIFGELDVTIEQEHVGLSFPLKRKKTALETPSEELGCDYDDRAGGAAKTRIYGVKREQERKRAEAIKKLRDSRKNGGLATSGLIGGSNMGSMFGVAGSSATCTLVDGNGGDAGKAAGDLQVDGRFFMRPQDVAGNRCFTLMPTYRAPAKGQVLVDLVLGFVSVRVAASEGVLREGGRCGVIGGLVGLGRGGFGSIGHKVVASKKVLAARGKTKVYFPDGTPAGYHMRGVTRMKRATRVGKRLCIDHENVSTQLCFDHSDLVTVIGR